MLREKAETAEKLTFGNKKVCISELNEKTDMHTFSLFCYSRILRFPGFSAAEGNQAPFGTSFTLLFAAGFIEFCCGLLIFQRFFDFPGLLHTEQAEDQSRAADCGSQCGQNH